MAWEEAHSNSFELVAVRHPTVLAESVANGMALEVGGLVEVASRSMSSSSPKDTALAAHPSMRLDVGRTVVEVRWYSTADALADVERTCDALHRCVASSALGRKTGMMEPHPVRHASFLAGLVLHIHEPVYAD